MKNYAQKGFSLIEIVLALGIISVALVAIIGLVSTSLNSAKESKDDTAMALMTQTATTELRKIGYAVLTKNGAFNNATYNGNSVNFYFDSNGNLSRNSSGVIVTTPSTATTAPLYSCKVTVSQPTGLAIQKDGTQATGLPLNCAFVKLEFAWPYTAATPQKKTIFTSVAKYDDF